MTRTTYKLAEPDEHGYRPCARGERCASAVTVQQPDGSFARQALNGPRPFCSPDRDFIGQSLAGIPELYEQLAETLGEKSPGTGPAVSGSHEAPIPLRVDVDELMRRIVSTLSGWDERVADIARLSVSDTKISRNQRHAWLLPRMVGRIRAHLDALLVLEPEPMIRYRTIEEARDHALNGGFGWIHPAAGYAEVIEDRSGIDAAEDILDLERRCLGILQVKPKHLPLPMPCWECDCPAVQRLDGPTGLRDEAECTACGETYTLEKFHDLMTHLTKQQATALQARRRAEAAEHAEHNEAAGPLTVLEGSGGRA
jgi:hypothetical protein